MAMIFEREGGITLPPKDDAAPAILAECYTLLSIALFLILLRCYGRIRITKNWGWDDTTIILAWISLFVGAVLVNLAAARGLGKHVQYLKDPQQASLDILKYTTFFQMDTVLCTLLTKISISLYILRIKNDKRFRRFLWIPTTLMSLVTLAMLIVLWIACIPLKALWTPEIKGNCIGLDKVYTTTYVQSGFTIVTDLALTISPVVILWNVQIKRARKLLICLLMSLGLVATVSNALRNVFIPELTSKDYPHALTPITMLSILELSSGVIAACVPACMFVFKWRELRRGGLAQRKGSGYEYNTQNSNLRTGDQHIRSWKGFQVSAEDAEDARSLSALYPGATSTTVTARQTIRR